MSARIPAASYKSLIRISVERGPLNQMDATVDLNYYPRPRAIATPTTPNGSKFYVNYRPRLHSPRRPPVLLRLR